MAMTTVLGAVAGQAVASGIAKLKEDSPQVVLNNAKKALAVGQDLARSTDLVSYTQAARVEPTALIDARCVNVPFINDVVHTNANLFLGYYLQAISMDDAIDNISMLKRLEKFNPDRSLLTATRAMLESHVSMESSYVGLVDFSKDVGFGESVSLESDASDRLQAELDATKKRLDLLVSSDADSDKNARRRAIEHYKGQVAKLEAQLKALSDGENQAGMQLTNRDIGKLISEVGNLAIGKVIEVAIRAGEQIIKMPITFRLKTLGAKPELMVEVLTTSSFDGSFKSRWRQLMAGEINWKELVFATDRIDAYKRTAMKDDTGFFQLVNKRSAKGLAAHALTGIPSVGAISAMVIIHDQTRREFERKTMQRLSDINVRNQFFANSHTLLLTVVDPDSETITIYTRGIDEPTELTVRQLGSAGKADGGGIQDILKAYEAGKAPGRF